MSQHTARNWGLALAALLLGFTPRKKGAASTTPAPGALPQPQGTPGERPAPSSRPEASKVEPSSIPTQGEPDSEGSEARIRERLRLEQEQDEREAAAKAAKKAAKKKADGEGAEHKKPEHIPTKSKLTFKEKATRELQAQKFGAKQHQAYTEAGHLPELAAAEALVSYLLAGGSNPAFIKQYQHMMDIPESGSFDISTQTKVEELLDAGVVMAADNMLKENFKGEDPSQAAAESLALYVIAAQEDPAHIVIPREWMSALQMQFMTGFSGTYDQATKDALVRHGITPP